MTYFMLQRIRGDEPGFPVFFDYKLDRATAGSNSQENAFVELLTGFSQSPLTFICKHKRIEFDFYELKAGEFFISDVLWAAMQSLSLPEHRIIDARFVSSKGTRITDKNYHVLRINEPIDAVDKSRSVIEQSQKYDYLKITRHVELATAAVGGLDVFRIDDMTLGGGLFCSDRCRDAALANGAKLQFVPECDAAEAYAKVNPLMS